MGAMAETVLTDPSFSRHSGPIKRPPPVEPVYLPMRRELLQNNCINHIMQTGCFQSIYIMTFNWLADSIDSTCVPAMWNFVSHGNKSSLQRTLSMIY